VGKQFLTEFWQWDRYRRSILERIFLFLFWASASGAFRIISDTLVIIRDRHIFEIIYACPYIIVC